MLFFSEIQKLKSDIVQRTPTMQQVTEDGNAILSSGGTGNVQNLGKTLVKLQDNWDKVKAGVDIHYNKFHKAVDDWATCKGDCITVLECVYVKIFANHIEIMYKYKYSRI